MFFSSQLPGDAEAAGWGPRIENHWTRLTKFDSKVPVQTIRFTNNVLKQRLTLVTTLRRFDIKLFNMKQEQKVE